MTESWKIVRLDEVDSRLLVVAKFYDHGYTISWLEMSDGCPKDNAGWIQDCSAQDFDEYSKIYNPSIKGSRSSLLNRLKRSTLDATDETKFHISGSYTSEERTLGLKSPLSDSSSLHFTWRYECIRMAGEEYSNNFLKPLFRLTTIFNHQCNLLVKTISQKDREIDEHRANGSILKRSHLQTETFDEKTFVANSLKEQLVLSSLANPAGSLLESGWTPPALELAYARPGPLPSSPKQKRSPKKPTLAASDIHDNDKVARLPSEAQKPSVEEEEEQERKRRAELEQLKASSAPKRKKKQKSVF